MVLLSLKFRIIHCVVVYYTKLSFAQTTDCWVLEWTLNWKGFQKKLWQTNRVNNPILTWRVWGIPSKFSDSVKMIHIKFELGTSRISLCSVTFARCWWILWSQGKEEICSASSYLGSQKQLNSELQSDSRRQTVTSTMVELSRGGRVKLEVYRHHNENKQYTHILFKKWTDADRDVYTCGKKKRQNGGWETEVERDMRSYGMHEGVVSERTFTKPDGISQNSTHQAYDISSAMNLVME